MGHGKRNNLQLDSKDVLFSSKSINPVSKEETEREAEKFQRAKLAPTRVDAEGNKFWENTSRELHRDGDLPAIEYADGRKEWYQNGKLHRDNDLPAVEKADGGKCWFQNGKLHRDNDLPAHEGTDGRKEWYQNGKLHRDNDLPAVEYADGSKEWWKHGERRIK